MKRTLVRSLLWAALLPTAASGALQAAQDPLGLPRLKVSARSDAPPALASGKYSVDALAPGNGRALRRSGVDILALESASEWSRPLRGSPNEIVFVSFQIHASESTIIDIGGARLGVTPSPVGGNVQLMYDESIGGALQWRSLNFHLQPGRYENRPMAALPTLTVRLDPDANTWDLYLGTRLLANDLPLLSSSGGARVFRVRAGGAGAWITGLVVSDENPLYVDDNGNGIDDAYEKSVRAGKLLAKTAPPAEKSQLARTWMAAQQTRPPPALFVRRPSPD